MGSSAKLLHAPLNRHLLSLNPHLRLSSRSLLSFPNRNPNPNPRNSLNLSQIGPRSAPFSSSSLLSQLFSSNRPKSPPPDPIQGAFHVWDRAIDADEGGGDERFLAEGGAAWTVVLLGWLGAEHKHLKRYAEIYNGRGIRSVRFVVPVKELMGLDLGRRVEERIGVLATDLARWCAETEEDGRERRLLFHTFSNTGWLAYGSILENWQSRSDLLEKIDGCVVDSGPAPELSPQVWAAGFGAALLKKRSSLIYSDESNKGDNKDRPAISETIVLAILEKFFCVILNLPEIKHFSSVSMLV